MMVVGPIGACLPPFPNATSTIMGSETEGLEEFSRPSSLLRVDIESIEMI